MATATYSSNEFSGGSASDRLNLTTCAAAASADLTLLHDNVAFQATAESHIFTFDSGSFSDFTGAVLVLRNASNHEEIAFVLNGDVTIGRAEDLNDRGFELVIGDRDLFNTHTDEIDLCDDDAQLVCRNENTRFVVRHILDIGNSSLTGEPGARNGIRIRNSNADSRIRLTVLGGRSALDSDYPGVGAGGNQYGANKPAGTEILKWEVSDDVPVRDLEWYSGYLDWRMDGDWAPPTRAVFQSESGIKFLVNSDAGRPDNTRDDPLIFGNAQEPFVLNLGTVAGSWWLEGIASTEDDSRIVYLNTDGPNWATQVALFGQGRAKVIENHLVVDYRLIDALGSPISGALVRLHSRDPQISAPASSGTPSIDFPAASARINTSTSNADGEGSLGGATGAYDQAVVVEALGRRITGGAGGTGTVDGAYTSAAHAKADYGSHVALTYDVFSFGRQILTNVAWTAVLSGQAGAGKQTLGVVQLNDELNLTAADSASVPATAATFDDVFDILYDWAITNRSALPFTASAGDIDFGSLAVTFDASGGALAVDLAAQTITVPCAATLDQGTIHRSLTTTGSFTATGVTILGRITDANGTPSTVTIVADDGDTVAYYLADGTEISRSALSGTDRTTFGLTPAQSAAGQRIAVAKSGFESRIRTISTAGGGRFTSDMASLVEKRGPGGEAQFDAANVDARVSVAFDLADLANVSARIDVANAQVRAAHAFNRFELEKLGADGMQYIAFGGQEPGVLMDPVNGDALYLPSEVRIRRKAAGDSNATVLATVYHVDGTPIDSANGDVSVVGGRILSDFAQNILVETDLDLDRAGVQSLAGLMVNVRKELVTHGVGAELTVVVILPEDDDQRDAILNFRSGDDISLGGTFAQVFSQVVNADGVYSLYLIGRGYPISTPLTISKGRFTTTLSAANMQTVETDISAVGHWAVRETTIVGFMLDMRDRIDATRTAAEAAPSAADILAEIQSADFEAGAGTNSLAQVLALIRSDISSIPSSGSGSGTGGTVDATEILNAIGYSIFGSGYRGVWVAGTYGVDMYALHEGVYYRCTAARTSSDTDDPATDTGSWEVAGLNPSVASILDTLANSSHGLAALRGLVAAKPTATEIVTEFQQADFEHGTGTKTLAELVQDILDGETRIISLEEQILGIEQNILDALNTRRVVSQQYTLGAPFNPGSSLLWLNNAIPDDEFAEAFRESPNDTRHPTGITLDNRDLSLPANSAVPGNIVLGTGETPTETSTTARLSSRFERTWEILIEYDDDSWRFTSSEFDLDETAPYGWTTTDADVRTRIGEAITAIGTNSGAQITFFTDNLSLRSIEQVILESSAGDRVHLIDQLGAAIFGDSYTGAWAAGDHAVGEVVWFNSHFYEVTAARTVSDTDDPTVDTASWQEDGIEEVVPTPAEIANAVHTEEFALPGGGTTRLNSILDIIRNNIRSNASALGGIFFGAAYEGRWETGAYAVGRYVSHQERYYRCTAARDNTNTDNPAVDTGSWEQVDVYPIIAALTNSTHGLAALKTLIDDIPTDGAVDPLGAIIFGASYQGAWAAGVYSEGQHTSHAERYYRCTADRTAADTDDPTVDTASWDEVDVYATVAALTNATHGLAALKTLIDALGMSVGDIPTSNPTASEIATAVEGSDVGTNVSSIKSDIEDTDHGLAALDTGISGISVDDAIHALGAMMFGDRYQGAWAAGTYAQDQYASHAGRYYRCIDARTGSDTDDPATDAVGWEAADVHSSIAAIPTSNPSASEIATAVEGSDVGTNAAAVRTAIENSTYGLSALKDLIDAVSTDDAINALGALMFGSSYRGMWAAGTYTAGQYSGHAQRYYRCTADRASTDTDNPATDSASWDEVEVYSTVEPILSSVHGLAALKTLIDDIPTSNPTASAIATAVATAVDAATTGTGVASIKSDIENATHGLSALQALVAGKPTASEIATAVEGSTVGTEITAIKDDVEDDTHGLPALQTLLAGLSTDAVLDAIGYITFGAFYQGEWTARVYTAGQFVVHSDLYYRCILGRDANDTDNPALDNTGWDVATISVGVSATSVAPTVAQIVTGILASTLRTDVSAIRNAVDSTTFGLSRLKLLIADNPTAAEISTEINASAVATAVTSIETMLESASSGLAAIKDAVDDIPADSGGSALDQDTFDARMAAVPDATKDSYKADVSTIPTDAPTVAEIVAGMQTADFEEGTGTGNLPQVLSGIKAAVDANKAHLEDSAYGLAALRTLLGTASGGTLSQGDVTSIANAVRDLDVVTGVGLVKSLQILLAVMIGQVVSQGTNVDIYTPVDGNRIATVPKFDEDNRPSGASIE